MKIHLECKDETSNKFWEIEVTGSSFTVHFGRIGAAGQTQTKEFVSEEEAESEADKMIKEKLRKGYQASISEGISFQMEPKVSLKKRETKETTYMGGCQYQGCWRNECLNVGGAWR